MIYAVVDFIAIEIIFACLFSVDDRGRIKFTFDWLFGFNKYQKTSLFVYAVIIISVAYFFLSNYVQNEAISALAATQWKTLPELTAALSFAVFWLTKIILGRKWRFKMVWMSLLILSLSLFIIFRPVQ